LQKESLIRPDQRFPGRVAEVRILPSHQVLPPKLGNPKSTTQTFWSSLQTNYRQKGRNMTRRRGNGEGSIYRRKDGLWVAGVFEEGVTHVLRRGEYIAAYNDVDPGILTKRRATPGGTRYLPAWVFEISSIRLRSGNITAKRCRAHKFSRH
jgi:hypothetical protein